jgi:Tfp pilus assembly protein FimT
MKRKPRQSELGVTLLELTIAVAIFAVVIGSAAQALISFNVALTSQRDRNVAVQQCRAIFARMREMRDNPPLVVPTDPTTQFPNYLFAQWPHGQAVAPANPLLRNEQITATYGWRDLTLPGTAAAPPPYDPTLGEGDPVEVTLTYTWTDPMNRPMQFTMTSVLTSD